MSSGGPAKPYSKLGPIVQKGGYPDRLLDTGYRLPAAQAPNWVRLCRKGGTPTGYWIQATGYRRRRRQIGSDCAEREGATGYRIQDTG